MCARHGGAPSELRQLERVRAGQEPSTPCSSSIDARAARPSAPRLIPIREAGTRRGFADRISRYWPSRRAPRPAKPSPPTGERRRRRGGVRCRAPADVEAATLRPEGRLRSGWTTWTGRKAGAVAARSDRGRRAREDAHPRSPRSATPRGRSDPRGPTGRRVAAESRSIRAPRLRRAGRAARELSRYRRRRLIRSGWPPPGRAGRVRSGEKPDRRIFFVPQEIEQARASRTSGGRPPPPLSDHQARAVSRMLEGLNGSPTTCSPRMRRPPGSPPEGRTPADGGTDCPQKSRTVRSRSPSRYRRRCDHWSAGPRGQQQLSWPRASGSRRRRFAKALQHTPRGARSAAGARDGPVDARADTLRTSRPARERYDAPHPERSLD